MPSYQHVRVERRGSVAWVILQRPEVRNALSDHTLHELGEIFETLAVQKAIRVVVLAGEGKTFCAGADLEWMKRAGQLTEDEAVKDTMLLVNALERLDTLPQVVIARVHGAALGGAMGILAASDIVVAEKDTRMGFPEVRLGLIPATIAPYVLRKIPESQARRYFTTGEIFSASIGKNLGLVHEVTEGIEALDHRVEDLIDHILKGGPEAVREAKSLIRSVRSLSPSEIPVYTAQLLARIRQHPEAQEGFSAFLEKRMPAWQKQGETP